MATGNRFAGLQDCQAVPRIVEECANQTRIIRFGELVQLQNLLPKRVPGRQRSLGQGFPRPLPSVIKPDLAGCPRIWIPTGLPRRRVVCDDSPYP